MQPNDDEPRVAVSFTKAELRTIEAALILYRDDTDRLTRAHPSGWMRDTLTQQHLSAVGELIQVRGGLTAG